ncbi:MAG: glycosyltransferase, partial [Caulobacterales bacterium]|nr:glycosyltransferase [Caulobacterales bacterium]
QPRRPGREMPVYTIIAPLYREANVARELVAALQRLDYPEDKLDIKLALEADDFDTQRAVRELALDARFELLVVPPGRPRTKPRALNYALAFARGDFVVVYDAEDQPHPGQLRAALAAFEAGGERLVSVQAPLDWWNAGDTWLTRQFALEYAAQFRVLLPAFARWGAPFPLGGTSNHFRREALERAGGWDPHNVTEDADIGFRLVEDGGRLGVIAPPTMEEAPTTVGPWLGQRTRWIKGFMQTWGVRSRRPFALARGAGPAGPLALALTLGLAIASSVVHGPLALWTLASLALAPFDSWLPLARGGDLMFLAAGYAAAAAVMALGAVRAGRPGLIAHILLTPLYWPLQTRAALKAAAQLSRDPFGWDKTRHGRARQTQPRGR